MSYLRSLQDTEVRAVDLTDRELAGLARMFAALARDEGASRAVALFCSDLSAQLSDILRWRECVLDGLDFDTPADEGQGGVPAG